MTTYAKGEVFCDFCGKQIELKEPGDLIGTTVIDGNLLVFCKKCRGCLKPLLPRPPSPDLVNHPLPCFTYSGCGNMGKVHGIKEKEQ